MAAPWVNHIEAVSKVLCAFVIPIAIRTFVSLRGKKKDSPQSITKYGHKGAQRETDNQWIKT